MAIARPTGLLIAATLLVGACAGAPRPPTAQEVWHEAGLRPGRVASPGDAETALLARLSAAPTEHSFTLSGQSFVVGATYTAASGRLCRAVTGAQSATASLRSPMARVADADAEAPATDASSPPSDAAAPRLACLFGDAWAFVPDVFSGDDRR